MNYQLFPALDQSEYESLKLDIAQRGVQIPIEIDEAGNVLDGHHRAQACQELGIRDYPTIIRPGLNEDQKVEHILALNLARRHLTRDARVTLVAGLRERGWSIPRIAERIHASVGTVANDLFNFEKVIAEVVGKDGKAYPAKRPAIMTVTANQRDEMLTALEELDSSDLPDKWITSKRISEMVRRQGNGESDLPGLIVHPEGRYALHLGSIESAVLGSFDHIITDPPYPAEFLECWTMLGQFAQAWLKPGGVLVAYSGHFHLDDVMVRLSTEGLKYHWVCALLAGGGSVHERKVFVGWKPVLVYTKDDYTGEWFHDLVQGTERQKELHEWQQDLAGVRQFVERFSKPGDTVCDPFMGSGTTGVACLQTGRNFVGIEKDPVTYAIAAKRIAEAASGEPLPA
jgi:ParB-like chromosome segregation protein Spo0J